jgi:hypothetical protein
MSSKGAISAQSPNGGRGRAHFLFSSPRWLDVRRLGEVAQELALQYLAHESGAVDLAGVGGSPKGVVEVTRNFESEGFGVICSTFSHII